MGTRSNPCAILSSRRSIQWSQQGGARLSRLILTLGDETIPSPGVHLLRQAPNSQVPFLEGRRMLSAGCCVIGWAFGRLARFLLLNDGHTSFLSADPFRQ
jgi:hypothetical protein